MHDKPSGPKYHEVFQRQPREIAELCGVPHALGLFPPGGQRGTTARVHFDGPNLTDAVQNVAIPADAPDEIELGADKQPRLNLYLYQVTPNAAWRNMCFPALDASGRQIANPPLALDLHYMLTAYGALDLQAEVLLGYAMLLLHETPVLARAAIRKSLDPPPSPGVAITWRIHQRYQRKL